MTVACVYASGHIAFLPEVPASLDALPICDGPYDVVQRFVSGIARHSRDGRHLLIPGMPECGEDQDAAMDAMFKFMGWMAAMKLPKGVKIYGPKGQPHRRGRSRSQTSA